MKISHDLVRRGVVVFALMLPMAASAGQLCVATGGQPLIEADGVSTPARVYFRSDVAKTDHYLDMHSTGAKSWAVLPAITEETNSIDYRVVTRSASGSEKVVSSGRIVTAGGCAAPKLRDEQRIAGMGLIIGATAEGPAVPAGFACEGIVGEINAKGELRAFKACQQIAMQSSTFIADATGTVQSGTSTMTRASNARNTNISADSLLTPGTTRVFPPGRRPNQNGNNPPPPNPRRDHPVSKSRP